MISAYAAVVGSYYDKPVFLLIGFSCFKRPQSLVAVRIGGFESLFILWIVIRKASAVSRSVGGLVYHENKVRAIIFAYLFGNYFKRIFIVFCIYENPR